MLTAAIVLLIAWNVYGFLLAEQWHRELVRIERYWQGERFTPDPGFVAQLKARVLKAVAEQRTVSQ